MTVRFWEKARLFKISKGIDSSVPVDKLMDSIYDQREQLELPYSLHFRPCAELAALPKARNRGEILKASSTTFSGGGGGGSADGPLFIPW